MIEREIKKETLWFIQVRIRQNLKLNYVVWFQRGHIQLSFAKEIFISNESHKEVMDKKFDGILISLEYSVHTHIVLLIYIFAPMCIWEINIRL